METEKMSNEVLRLMIASRGHGYERKLDGTVVFNCQHIKKDNVKLAEYRAEFARRQRALLY